MGSFGSSGFGTSGSDAQGLLNFILDVVHIVLI